jgi:hypothetical protein
MRKLRDAATYAAFGLLFAAASSEFGFYAPDWLRPLGEVFILGAIWYCCRAFIAVAKFGGGA